MAALWRPLGLLHFLVCPTRVLQWSSKKRQKHIKINGLGRFWGTLLGRPIWTMWTKNAFPCSVLLVSHFPEAFPCSVALVLGFLTFSWVAQHGPVRASKISINPMHFCIFWKRIQKGWCARSGCERLNSSKFVGNMNTLSEESRSHAECRSFFIQKGVLRGRFLGRMFALSFQKQFFRTSI